MKKVYFAIFALLISAGASAQCVIDSTILDSVSSTDGAVYPSAQHLPHIVQDSLYDQTVLGEIPSVESITIVGFTVSLTIDSVDLDSISGLPTGINWVKNATTLPGGGLGCVEFTGTTTDTAGTYNITGVGRVWGHITYGSNTVTVDTFLNLNLIPPFRTFYLVVDSAQSPLSVSITGNQLCYGDTAAALTAFAAGGSPVSPYTYAWSAGGSITYNTNGTASNSYTVTVTSGAATATASTTVIAETTALGATLSTDSSLSGTNGSVTAAVSGGVPPYSYIWSNGGTADSISGLVPGTYRVTVIDSFGCAYRDSAVVYGVSGINLLSQLISRMELFPNPANEQMNVLIASQKTISAKLEALDMTGRVLYSAPVTVSGHYNAVLDISQFSSGVYVLQLSSEQGSVQQRFTVTH